MRLKTGPRHRLTRSKTDFAVSQDEATLAKSLGHLFSVLREEKVPFQVHAGFACFLHGTYTKLDDIDLRVYCDNLSTLCARLTSFGFSVSPRPPLFFKDRAYLNPALVVAGPPRIEICSEMTAVRDGWTFRFPYSRGLFTRSAQFVWKGLVIPTATLNFLALYYAVLRRNGVAFNDATALRSLFSHSNFGLASFQRYVARCSDGGHVWELIKTICGDFIP
jgi:hypothetical protein